MLRNLLASIIVYMAYVDEVNYCLSVSFGGSLGKEIGNTKLSFF